MEFWIPTLCLNSLTGMCLLSCIIQYFLTICFVFSIMFFFCLLLCQSVPLEALQPGYGVYVLHSFEWTSEREERQTVQVQLVFLNQMSLSKTFFKFFFDTVFIFYMNIILKIDSSTCEYFYSFLSHQVSGLFFANLKSYLFSKTWLRICFSVVSYLNILTLNVYNTDDKVTKKSCIYLFFFNDRNTWFSGCIGF